MPALDGVTHSNGMCPTALTALAERRRALAALQDIDTLLAESANSDRPRSADVSRVHGSLDGFGAADFRHPRRSAAVALRPPSQHTSKKTALVTIERRRITDKPGPGSYDVQHADSVVKRRVLCAVINASSNSCLSKPGSVDVSDERRIDLMSTDAVISTRRVMRGLVAYQEPRVSAQQLAQRATRAPQTDFYDVRHSLTEPRQAAGGVIPMRSVQAKPLWRHVKKASRRERDA